MTHVVDVDTIEGLDVVAPRAARARVDEAKQSIDDLIGEARRYRSGERFRQLLDFVSDFRELAPFNAMLVHVQKPGSRFVATAHRWRTKFGRVLLPGARPLVVLQNFGPVVFVYDVSDTVPLPGAPNLPPEVERPFETLVSGAGGALSLLCANASRDGVRITYVPAGSQSAGSIRPAERGHRLVPPRAPGKADAEATWVPVRYELHVNEQLDESARYATVLHELGHLYCGHVGTPNEKWWPDRRLADLAAREVEAEATAYITARRMDERAVFPPYLDGYVGPGDELPLVSLERILKVAGDLEKMSRSSRGVRRPGRPAA